jgi:putative membrane protein
VVRAGPSQAVPVACLVCFLGVWGLLAIAPRYRADWLLENLLVVVLVPLLVVGYRCGPLSDRAYVQITVFLILHTVGSHYTYSEVPIGDWARDAFGLARNHYDRVVHFSFGVLMLRPLQEVILGDPPQLAGWRRAWMGVASVAFCSLAYELIEWAVASVADPAAGTAYLGTQGDPWDAQKDMALALLGAVIAAGMEGGAAGWAARRPPVRG